MKKILGKGMGEITKDYLAHYLKTNKPVVIIVCGYPGSGKSTWIKNNLELSFQYFNTDSMKTVIKKMEQREPNRQFCEWLEMVHLQSCIREKLNVVKETPFFAWEMHLFFNQVFKEIGVKAFFIYVDKPAEECFQVRKHTKPLLYLENKPDGDLEKYWRICIDRAENDKNELIKDINLNPEKWKSLFVGHAYITEAEEHFYLDIP